MSVGRNDPCPCGSGRKYKRCCMLAEGPPAGSITPAMLSQCSQEAMAAILRLGRRTMGDRGLAQAWEGLFGSPGDPAEAMAERDPKLPLFCIWLAYLRSPSQQEGALAGEVPASNTLAAQFLREGGYRVAERTRRFIEATRREPLTFWQVQEVKRESGLLLRDMATGRERYVFERSATRTVVPWDILFGQVVGLEDVYILNASGPYCLPGMRFRQRVEDRLADLGGPAASTDLAHWLRCNLQLVHLYLECAQEALHPRMPELRNTDGHRLEWATSTYRFDPAQRGRILGRLDSMRNLEALSEEGEYTWVSQRQDTPIPGASKAHLKVEADRLVTECNSRERDRALRTRVEKDLADLVEHEDTVYKALDLGALRQAHGDEDEAPSEEPELTEEGRAAMQAMVDQMRMGWIDQSVPALGGIAPRAAVKTPEGRRRVEDLLHDFENAEARRPQAERFDYNRVRRELGLEED